MNLDEWIIYGEIGISSKTMWAAITGIVTGGSMRFDFNVPHDSDDFSRCYKLWKQCGITAEQLNRVSTVFPWWKPFIDNWDKLVSMFENKEPMYEYIQTLEYESMILDGWVEISKGSWTRKHQ